MAEGKVGVLILLEYEDAIFGGVFGLKDERLRLGWLSEDCRHGWKQ